MNKTAEEILLNAIESYNCHPHTRFMDKFRLSDKETKMFVAAMESYASQSKEEVLNEDWEKEIKQIGFKQGVTGIIEWIKTNILNRSIPVMREGDTIKPIMHEDDEDDLMAEEERTERNMNVISAFCDHLKQDGIEVPESSILSFFNA